MKKLVIGLGIIGLGLIWALRVVLKPPQTVEISSSMIALNAPNTSGFEQVVPNQPFTFPADHGPHPGFQTEWWYYTGNLSTADGREFGYQLTFFRQALAPQAASRASDWAAHELYFAHFTITDLESQQFYFFDHADRGALGLAGATSDPYAVVIGPWSAKGDDVITLTASKDGIALNLRLESLKPPTLQGQAGYSRKSPKEGNASYYYSLTRLKSSGIVTIDGTEYAVDGLSWFDHEWTTSPLDTEQVGWQWYGLHLDDGRDVMWGELRRADGSVDWSLGSVTGDQVLILEHGDATLTSSDTWTSSTTGIEYPARWHLSIPKAGLELDIVPVLADQELRLFPMIYWEGAVRIEGTTTGKGYVELTGYGSNSRSPR